MATAAKSDREGSIRLLEARVATFKSLLHPEQRDGDQPVRQNLRRIKSQLAKLKEDYERFVNSHNKYRHLAKLDGEELATDDSIFQKLYQEYDDLSDDAAELIEDGENIAPLGLQEKVSIAKNEVSAVENMIVGQLNAVQTSLEEEDSLSSTTITMLTAEIDSCQTKLSTDLVEKYTVLGQLDSGQLDTHFTARKDFTSQQMGVIHNLKKLLAVQCS